MSVFEYDSEDFPTLLDYFINLIQNPTTTLEDVIKFVYDNYDDLKIGEERIFTGQTALQASIEACRVDIFRLLITYGVCIHCINGTYDFTPLTVAVANNYFDIVRDLVEMKIDVNKPSQSGLTALYHAIKNVNVKMTKFLLENGAKVSLLPKDFIETIENQEILDLIEKYRYQSFKVVCKSTGDVLFEGENLSGVEIVQD